MLEGRTEVIKRKSHLCSKTNLRNKSPNHFPHTIEHAALQCRPQQIPPVAVLPWKTVSQKGAPRSTNGSSALRDKQHVQIKPGVSSRVKALAANRNGKARCEYDLDLIHTCVCNPIHPNTTFSHHDAAKEKEGIAPPKCGYSKEANQCSMGAPVEEQNKWLKINSPDDLGKTRRKGPQEVKTVRVKADALVNRNGPKWVSTKQRAH